MESIPIRQFFTLLSGRYKVMVIVAYIAAFCAGLGFPSIALVMGSITKTFDPSGTGSIAENMFALFKNIMIIAAVMWCLGYIYYSFFQHIAEKIAYELRGKYLRALLRQEVSYFELNNVEAMPSDIGQYFQTISTGIGESYGQLLQSFGLLIGGFAIAFARGPIFALVCIAYMPLMLILIVVLGGISKRAAFAKLKSNKDLGGFTEECISALKLVVSFSQEDRMIELYKKKAAVTMEISKVANRKTAIMFGCIRTLIFGFFLYAFYIATVFVEKGLINPNTAEPYTISEIVAVNQAMIMSMM
jgi:ATP-binding cassette, subfamily B (MDR/TAP), member 1